MSNSFNILKALWLMACAAVLSVTLRIELQTPGSDIGTFFAISMIALTFPSGLAVVALIAGYVWIVGDPDTSAAQTPIANAVGYSFAWLAMVLCGYLQWFTLLPNLFNRFKSRH